MIFLEMSRVDDHGGGTWAFPNCIWSPTKKKDGTRWTFWEKILSAKEGDIVIHLRGVQPKAFFVGYSQLSGDGFITSKRPPFAGAWSHSSSFYRADLINYMPFHQPVSLSEIFLNRRNELEQYFHQNKEKGSIRRNIFFVHQAGRLQCLNGAYLSEVDENLFAILFGQQAPTVETSTRSPAISIETQVQLRTVYTRLGQAEFSRRIKSLYAGKCCFPSCKVDDARFLIGAHIARWSDNDKLRGHLGNGLCLCVFHDRAFELGLFTLDEHHRVYINPRELNTKSTIIQNLLQFNGQQIALAKILPLDDAILEHWIRVDISP